MRYMVHVPNQSNARGGTSYYLGSAMTPHMTRHAAAWSSRGKIYGQPGTRAIPAPPPAAVPQYSTAGANAGTSRSKDAPNVIFPPLYWEAEFPKEHAPVSRISDNQMPIPAGRPANVVVFKAYVTRKGGQRQVYQPQVVQRWLGLRGTPNG